MSGAKFFGVSLILIVFFMINMFLVYADITVTPTSDELVRWNVSGDGASFDDFNNNKELNLTQGGFNSTVRTIGTTLVNVTTFDDSGQYFVNRTANSTPSLDCAGAGGCSFAAWVNISPGLGCCLPQTIARMGEGDDVGWTMFVNTGTRLTWGNSVEVHAGDNSITVRQWAFIVGVINSTTGKELWIDNVLSATSEDTTQTVTRNTLYIGTYAEISWFWQGDMYCMRFYNASLDGTQINALYNNGEPTCDTLETLLENNAPTVFHETQFINNTNEHSFNATAAFQDLDGNETFANLSITTTSGTCSGLFNDTTSFSNVMNYTFNCTGTGLASTTIIITANDTRTGHVATASVTNTYPNFIPIVIPSINNTPIEATEDADVSWFFIDLDNGTDSEDGFSIRWFVNGAHEDTGDGQRTLLAANYSTDDSIIAQVNVTDGISTSISVNTTNVTIGDTTAPLILDNRTSSATPTVDTTVVIFVNVSDASADISSVTIQVRDPNEGRSNLTGLLYLGTNAAGQETGWNATYTVSIVGVHQIQVYVSDSSGNDASTLEGFLNFTVVAADTTTTTTGGGGGGAITQVTETIIQPQAAFSGCGDNICSEDENPSLIKLQVL